MNKTLDYYNKNAHAFVEGTQDVAFTEMQDHFLKCIPEGGRILDFGCGSGRDTKYFLSMGFEVEATDGSEEMVRVASEYAGISVNQQLFEDLDAEAAYDGVWACSSILHLDVERLRDVLRKICIALKPGGILYTSFKYGTFSGERNGRYFTDMTEEAFSELLETVGGFRTVEMWLTSDVRPGRNHEKWLNILLQKTE